jgi:hypothetical protein
VASACDGRGGRFFDVLALARTLVNFYCDKLEDADTIIPALQGLHTLASIPTFAGIETTATFEAYDNPRFNEHP